MDVRSSKNIELLIVDGDSRVAQAIQSCFPAPEYHCVTVNGREAALKQLQKLPFSLVLCDVRLEDGDGMEVLRRGLAMDTPPAFLMLTAPGDWGLAVEAMKMGAYDCLEKPFRCDQLVVSVERALERRQLKAEREMFHLLLEQALHERTEHLHAAFQQVEESQQCTLETLVAALDAREHETNLHSLRVQAFTVLLAEKCGYSSASMRQLSHGALLHDIGKIVIPDTILLKPGKLTPEEFQIVQRHTTYGHQILSRIPYLRPAALVALSHHERIDGTGYPLKLKGDTIPLPARVFSVADTLDVITAGRPYCPSRSMEAARAEILRSAGTQFDKDVVDVFWTTTDEEWFSLRDEVARRYETVYQPLSAAPALQSLPF